MRRLPAELGQDSTTGAGLRWCILLSGVVVWLGGSPPLAQAQSASAARRAAAQTLFDEGRALMAQGRHAEACPKLEESARLVHGIGALFNLASCHEAAGRLATAWAGYLATAAAARSAGQSDREQAALSSAAALEARLPRLTVEVLPPVKGIQGLTILRDGEPVTPGQWGLALPVDPGEHRILVSAPGYAPFESSVVVREAERTRVPLRSLLPVTTNPESAARVPDVRQAPQGGPARPGSASVSGVRLPTDPGAGVGSAPAASAEPPIPPKKSPLRPVGFSIALLGAAGVGVGSVFGVDAISKANQAADPDLCNRETKECTPAGEALRQQGLVAANRATVSLVLGGSALATGVLILLLAPKSQPRRLSLGPFTGASPAVAGLELRGHW